MTTKHSIFGLTLTQAVRLFTLLTAIISIWVHLEISLAEVNVEIINLKQDLVNHKTDNRKDFENLQTSIPNETTEILRKVDGIEIYLRIKH